MINNGGPYASAGSGGEGIPAPSAQNQELVLEAWREVLAEVLHTRDNEWKQQLRAIKSESLAAVAEMRANAAEIRGSMEKMIEQRLAQIREPADGPRGEQGERGERGLPGQLRAVKQFVEGGVHYDGDVVMHMGSTYQARRDTAREPPHEDWDCLAMAGRDGIDGRSLRVRGTWRADESYMMNDVATLNGGSFVARIDAPGECPGEGWQSLTMPGRRGPVGPAGEQGEKGERGERGPGIVGWDIDRDNYTVSAVLSDQTRSEPLGLRGLFEQYLLERITVDG
jgi:hypothetical protein